MVVKETTDSAWPKFAEWAITQTNPHLPNIYDLQVGDTTFATMERLIQFRHHPFTEVDLPLLYWILLKESHRFTPIKRMPSIIRRDVINFAGFKSAIELAEYFEKHKDELLERAEEHPFVETHRIIFDHFLEYGNDFKPGNIMIRLHTHEFVITDPIVGGPQKLRKI